MAKDKGMIGTEFLTDGENKPEQKTRVMTRDQKNYYHSRHWLAEVFLWDSAQKEAAIDQRVMMSYKGGRSDDIVEIARRGDKSAFIEGGVRPLDNADDRYKARG